MTATVSNDHVRSAEQTARLLLSNAFRYDTWESATARRELAKLGGVVSTVTFALQANNMADLAQESFAINLVLYDPSIRTFVGAAYRCSGLRICQPVVFQASPQQVLAIELLTRDERSNAAPESFVATQFAHCLVSNLAKGAPLPLFPGNAHLLLLDRAVWPKESTPGVGKPVGSIHYTCGVNDNPVLATLMRELVPPCTFVPESFTRATPQPGVQLFRIVLPSIEVLFSGSAAELGGAKAEWAVAAVAHNGYQQLGRGAEVRLRVVHPEPASASSYDASTSYYSSSYSSSSSSRSRQQPDSAQATPLHLRAQGPLELRQLPMHSATSLVLALRCRRPSEESFAVLGFCVMPLCLLPMKNRDVRVEQLPALRGPFSCDDARLLMVDSTAPYGKLPLAMTLTIEYHDVIDYDSAGALLTSVGSERPIGEEKHTAEEPPTAHHGSASLTGPAPSANVTSTSSLSAAAALVPSSKHATGTAKSKTPGVSPLASHRTTSTSTTTTPSATTASSKAIEKEEKAHTSAEEVSAEASLPVSTALVPLVHPSATGEGATSAEAVTTIAQSMLTTIPEKERRPGGEQSGVFRLLGHIMEELRRVRESQDELLRLQAKEEEAAAAAALGQPSPGPFSAQQKEHARGAASLEDTIIELLPHTPRRMTVSWKARTRIKEGQQPLLHPIHGTLLEDTAVASQVLPNAIFGIRFEGVTMDRVLRMPDDVCFMFSFGALANQIAGPMRPVSVERTAVQDSFKLYSEQRGGFVWCEPLESLRSVAMATFKEDTSAAHLYLHLYDALTMFYVATATLPLAQFRRPFRAECGVLSLDLPMQRDLSLTEQLLAPELFPAAQMIGQLHCTIFSVGVSAAYGPRPITTTKDAPEYVDNQNSNGNGWSTASRVVVAKRLPHADALLRKAATDGEVDGAPHTPPPQNASNAPPSQLHEASHDINNNTTAAKTLHQQRAAYVKQSLLSRQAESGAVSLPGVPPDHAVSAQRSAELEYKLRYLERERAARKTRLIAQALLTRITTHYHITVPSCRPAVVRTSFQNPYHTPLQFFVEFADGADAAVCAVLREPSFYLGPRERTEVDLVVRVNYIEQSGGAPDMIASGEETLYKRIIRAHIYSEAHELVHIAELDVRVCAPIVDRRYEIFGAAGAEVTKVVLSRVFSCAALPLTANQDALLERMRGLCAFATTSSPDTVARTDAVLDPLTQTYITAWEEVTLTTTIPAQPGQQRIEYVTLCHDAGLSRVYETWELSIFACTSSTTRAIEWGQTTPLAVPSEGAEELYCSDPAVPVERRGNAYVLRIRPTAVGTRRVLLHALHDGILTKTLLTIPAVYPTPSYTQVLEFSVAEVSAGPILRRLTFIHHGDREERFRVHHNYKFQLRVTPYEFVLAPGDSQFVTLYFSALTLPATQVEGRWPMWLFINNGDDKTVESYFLQVVLRAHPVVAA